jgi:hypothetical protein
LSSLLLRSVRYSLAQHQQSASDQKSPAGSVRLAAGWQRARAAQQQINGRIVMISAVMERMHSNSSASSVMLGLVVLASAAPANAGCLDSLLHGHSAPEASAGQFVPAVYRPDDLSGARLMPVSDSGHENDSIVGLWEFRLDGFAVDWGTQAWHSDGTEIMFSGGQDPATGDVCQGVWRKVGRSTYVLNHIAMGWVAPGGPFGIRVHFHMQVTLDRSGNAFAGTYQAAVYSVSPADPFDESVQVASGTGTATATRVRAD